MSIQFCIGTAKENHAEALLLHASEWLQQDVKHDVFYIVPNHVKFETEVNVLKSLHELPPYQNLKNMASTRLQIFSFSRLAWHLMQHTASYQQKVLSESGKLMLLKQVLLEYEAEIELYRYELNKPGFMQQLIELFDELQLGNIAPEDLEVLQTALDQQHVLKDTFAKLSDLQLIYRYYLEKCQAVNGETEDVKSRLADYLSEKDLSNVMFIISGFSSLTAVEKKLMAVLCQVAGEVKVSLVLDRPYPDRLPESHDLFYHPGQVYFELYQTAKMARVPILFDQRLSTSKDKDLIALDEIWRESQTLSVVKETRTLSNNRLAILSCEDPYGEMVVVAKEIRRLVAEENYRYRDILLLTREASQYQKVLEPVFTRHDIPYYLNEESEMKHHPLIEWTTTLFRMKDRYYQEHDVLRFLRTELFKPNFEENVSLEEWEEQQKEWRRQIDYTENVVLASGFSGHDWLREWPWRYVTYQSLGEEENNQDQLMEKASNEVREAIRANLPDFYQAFEEAKTYEEACVIFYNFLISSGVEHQLKQFRQQALSRGELVMAKNHEHIWQELMNLLDEFVELLGTESFEWSSFEQILISGLEGITYRKVPATVDQLMVSSVDFVQAEKRPVTIIIGMTDQSFPKKIENKTLLTDEERLLFKTFLVEDKYLKKDANADFIREPYVFYLALLSSTERLILTYPKRSDQVKDLKPSPYLSILSHGLSLQVQEVLTEPELNYLDVVTNFSTDRMLLRDLVGVKRRLQEDKLPLSWLWQQLEKRLLKKMPLQTERVLESLTYQNIPETLTEESVDALYGATIRASISKVESFYLCQYRYFLQHGLKLKPRQVYELSPAVAGDFYHEVLDAFFKELVSSKRHLSDLTKEEVRELSDSVLKRVLGDHRFSILDTSHRMLYIKYQLEKTIHRMSWSLREQSHRSGMTTLQTELLFGEAWEKVGVAGLEFPLQRGKSLKVRGKIDRVDHMQVAGVDYLSVVDYKSSKHEFNFIDAYYGLALQMITYLDVALRNAEKLVKNNQVKAAGAFYLHVKNPTLKPVIPIDEEVLNAQMLKEFRYEGILLKDPLVLEHLDKEIEPGVSSLVYPYRQIKKEEAMKSSQFVTEQELSLLLKNNESKFKDAGEAIFAGSTKLDPAYDDSKKERVACGYCPFRSVCQFDVMLKENEYHRLKKLTKEEIINELSVPEEEVENGQD